MRTLLSMWLVLSCVATVHAAPTRDTIVVMTQNQYFGADLTPVIGATTIEELQQAVRDALVQIQANNFPERARAMAEEIADWQPEVVALQEAFQFTLNGNTTDTPPFLDQLDVTLQALAAHGVPYRVGASVRNTHLTFQAVGDFDHDGLPDDVEVTDRDVLLVRADIPANDVSVVSFPCDLFHQSANGCTYQVVATIPKPPPFGPITLERGFVGLDATIGDRAYRVVNTHLELREVSEAIQAAQATELLGTLQTTTPAGRALMVLGDMNSFLEDQTPSDPIVPPYLQFLDAGFVDVWSLRPGNAPGLTCCQAEDLRNHQSALYERIDLILTNFQPRKVKARLVGNRVADKTRPDRLWPSDHAGVVAELTVD